MKIFVVDTETTGLDGAHGGDRIVEIAICEVDTELGTIQKVYESIVGHDTKEWDEWKKDAWIFQNSDLTLEKVEKGPPANDVIKEVRKILDDKNVTSYNTGFDWHLFLELEPWNIPYFRLMPCIMLSATPVCKIGRSTFHNSYSGFSSYGYKWPTLEEAYRKLIGRDLKMNSHRAMADCYKSSVILVKLLEGKFYKHN